MIRVTFTVNPFFRRRNVGGLRTLATLDRRDMRKLTAQADKAFRAHEIRLFSTEGRHGGRRWAKLTPEYAKRKAKTHPGRKILQRTGRLRRSLAFKSNPEHVADFVVRPRPIIFLGTDVPYAVYHQTGTPTMVARNPVQHRARQQRRYTKLIVDYIRRRAERLSRQMSRFNRGRRRRR